MKVRKISMQIGNRVIIKTGHNIPEELSGHRGIIVDEKIPESQMAMLCGFTNFVVKLDEPVKLVASSFAEITMPIHMLELEREAAV